MVDLRAHLALERVYLLLQFVVFLYQIQELLLILLVLLRGLGLGQDVKLFDQLVDIRSGCLFLVSLGDLQNQVVHLLGQLPLFCDEIDLLLFDLALKLGDLVLYPVLFQLLFIQRLLESLLLLQQIIHLIPLILLVHPLGLQLPLQLPHLLFEVGL